MVGRERLFLCKCVALPGPELSFRCFTCHDRGFLRDELDKEHPDFGKAIPCPECALKQQPERTLAASGLPEGAERLGFSFWNRKSNPGCQGAFKAALAFAEGKPPLWLCLLGPPGLGKTHLACAATCRLAERNQAVRYISAPHLLAHLGSLSFPEMSQERERLKKVETLILDDVGAGSLSAWNWGLFEELLDGRYLPLRRTLITSNLGLEAFPPRTRSRLTAISCHIEMMEGLDFRQGKGL